VWSAPSRLRSERGFSLIELMVALMIMGVLLTVAIPIYLGAVERADDMAARASLHTAQVAGRTLLADGSGYEVVSLDALETAEPSVRWVDDEEPSLAPTIVSRAVVAHDLFLAAYSPTGTCFFLRDDPVTGVGRASLPGVERADCTALAAVGASFAPTW
jgi:prepilin-type N-terminal cleavage/methylation domain-containing protein